MRTQGGDKARCVCGCVYVSMCVRVSVYMCAVLYSCDKISTGTSSK